MAKRHRDQRSQHLLRRLPRRGLGHLSVQPCCVTAFIGPSGCGKSTVLRTLNRMHEEIPGARVEGKVLLDGEDIYSSGIDPVWVRSTIGMVFQRPNPFPTMSIRDNVVAGLRLQGVRSKKTLDEVAERALRGANLWTEVKDRLGQAGRRPVRRAAAAAVHRPGDRHPARRAVDGRAVFGAGPDFHAGRRGSDRRTQAGVHDRHRHAQYAAGRAGIDQTAFFNLAGVGQPGRLIEIDDTEKIFSNPTQKATEDYISGRFG